MTARLRTGLVAAILLVGLCAVQVRAGTVPPTVKVIFQNFSDKGVYVTFTGSVQAEPPRPLGLASRETKGYAFERNPRTVSLRVEHSLPKNEPVTIQFETGSYAKFVTFLGTDCKSHIQGYA